MSPRSATRQELEQSLRSLLPDELTLGGVSRTDPPALAVVGVGGLLTGYCWGWLRGRRTRRRGRQ